MPADPDLLFDGPTGASTTVALAHGAGASMDSPFMQFFAEELGRSGYRVARFEYPYMASKRVTGKQKPPDREPVLRETWLRVIEMLGRDGLVIGGKSMGGRIATLIADEAGVAGLICVEWNDADIPILENAVGELRLLVRGHGPGEGKAGP